MLCVFFFFSSRRRHTRCSRDWSSDVCSSDLEHYAGVFPTWLAPVQARVLPVSEKHAAYGRTVWEKLRAARVRAELEDRNEKLGYRIREGQSRKVERESGVEGKSVDLGGRRDHKK